MRGNRRLRASCNKSSIICFSSAAVVGGWQAEPIQITKDKGTVNQICEDRRTFYIAHWLLYDEARRLVYYNSSFHSHCKDTALLYKYKYLMYVQKTKRKSTSATPAGMFTFGTRNLLCNLMYNVICSKRIVCRVPEAR